MRLILAPKSAKAFFTARGSDETWQCEASWVFFLLGQTPLNDSGTLLNKLKEDAHPRHPFSASLIWIKLKCTIESRAKRSSINLIRTLFHITCSSHNVKTRVIIRVLRIILVVLPEHPSDTYVFTMKMEILLELTSNKLMVGKLGDSDVHTLEDLTLILEILLRRFFLRLNLPDHRSILTGSEGSSKDGDGDTSF
ncbi:hypothetical protein Tco_0821169 [Tanacetum coccineum]|uniref:Uncharacterized protein n=1 Tax=Tanacetum coccineum TaxID=301880 RepID=A0ABQ5ABI8_9ASTR